MSGAGLAIQSATTTMNASRFLATLAVTASLALAATAAAADKDWIVLFDGKVTDKLRGFKQEGFPDKMWVVDGDALKTVPGRGVDLITKDKFKDFELELEWKVAPGGNSGVMYRVNESVGGASWHTGPEMQILDDAGHGDGKNPKTSAGSLYALIAPNDRKRTRPVGEFNSAKIVFKDNQVQHWLNGEKIVEFKWGSADLQELIAKSKFAGMPRFMKEEEGAITFQHHGQEFWLRKVRVRRL